MSQVDVIALTRELISHNTINPPGNEAIVARKLGELLTEHGFKVELPGYELNRLHLVAEKGISASRAPLVLSGHLDTVPLGNKPWKADPFSGISQGDKIFGRGSSDMKSGVAAMTVAAIEATSGNAPEDGIRLIFTAGEELGCQGALQLVSTHENLGKACAIIVGEPTANIPITGHKGALYLNAVAKGKTAHSSMPEQGDNAIYKAAKCISGIEEFRFQSAKDPLLGFPSINVGMMQGGLNINSVPDHAEFSIDIRSTTMIEHSSILQRLIQELGEDIAIETLVDLDPVSTPESEPFVQLVYDICGMDQKNKDWPRSLPYLTDGSVLQPYYGGVPTIILGPGEPGMAHKTDEYCFIENIIRSVSIYKNIILNRSS
ncbi:MAG: M20 family metallopeptidase [Bacteroidota bacterium]|nr:M20 family metallopeptidase [Bacteroidota bacterium]